MTFRDFVDGVDSFRHDGLREGAQRDIAWQPKKILLLMAAMIGRIVAGWQADADSSPERSTNLFPFREYLIAANRKDCFLGSVFDYDPRFSILDYGAAGLKPLLQTFPHFAFAIMENGILRCELCPAQVPQNPPLLRIHFLKPLRAPVPPGTLSTLYIVVLRRAPSFNAGSSDSKTETSYFESSGAALDALAFEPCDAFEIKCSKVERLFELAVTGELLICGPHRAEASTAARIAKTLGRTQAEQFAIDRFFMLGFRSGHGNEPWLERSASPAHDTDKIKKARKQFSHWKNTALFFLKAGRPQAVDIPGASIRQEALQFKDPALFPSLLANPVYEPLMSLFVTTDTEGRWVVDEPELHAFARNLNGGEGRVLSEAGEVITCCAESFKDPKMQSVFLFECAMGILLSAVGAHKNLKRLSKLKRAKDYLRQNYEQTFAVSLSKAPSVLGETATERAAQLVETESKLEETEQAIMGLLAEPLSRKVSDNLRRILDDLPKTAALMVDKPVPLIRLENRTTFEESITGLCAWLLRAGDWRGSSPRTTRSPQLKGIAVTVGSGRTQLPCAAALDCGITTGKCVYGFVLPNALPEEASYIHGGFLANVDKAMAWRAYLSYEPKNCPLASSCGFKENEAEPDERCAMRIGSTQGRILVGIVSYVAIRSVWVSCASEYPVWPPPSQCMPGRLTPYFPSNSKAFLSSQR